jgi:multicomponent Na+:H+ antiporter subunit C
MIWLLALTVFLTVSAGAYLALSRDMFRCVLGIGMMGAAANLMLFSTGRLGSARPAIVPLGEQVLGEAANSVPQALVLTAIVIGFALICFALVLVLRLVQVADTDDAEQLRHAEPLPDDPVKPPYTPAALEPVHPSMAASGEKP